MAAKKIIKKLFVSTIIAGTLAAAASYAAEGGSSASDIPVDRVILSTSGLANFELRAHVTDDAKLRFPVRLEQVDDILKSLIVFDKNGKLGGVTLPGKQPLAQVFKDLPFTQAQLDDPAQLLNAYQGATVTLKGASLNGTGQLLQVVPEEVALDNDRTVTRHRISIMTDGGMRQAILEDLISVTFDDPKIKAELSRALDAVRENGTSEQRMMTVNLLGKGARNVELSYVVDAPLWKSAYRLVLPEGDAKKGLLQGWAVIENMTASDWKHVDLTLVSGNPVTFRQNLYQSYYVQRPEIPVQVFGRVMPRVDEGTVATAADMERKETASSMEGAPGGMLGGRGFGGAMLKKSRMMNAPMAAAPAPMEMMRANSMDSLAAAQDAGTGMADVAPVANAAGSAEATTQVLFRFPNRFDLKSGQSLMLPFVSREVPMERVSVFQPETHPTHPLAAVELKNDGGTGLPPGVLTLYEESPLLKGTSFVGDAQLPVLSKGEKRLVSYALDSKTSIDRKESSDSTQGEITVAKGVLRVAYKNRATTTYTIKAPEKEARTIIIEHPKRYDYDIVSPDPKDVEVSNGHYRIRVKLKAGEKKVVPVVLENRGWQTYMLSGMSSEQFTAYATGTSGGHLDAAARRSFGKLAEKRREIDDVDRKIAGVERQRQAIIRDQSRVRQNLMSLNGKSDVKEKYLAKLNTQEDELEKLDAAKEKLSALRQQKQGELSDMIADIKL
ncbi:MAG: DUF4139 domain-containing protein [Alphaproteobacteria bacterium]|nr:DUF4139 domain-containing protein [Alphaproteobacteria bacterium]